MSMVHAACTDTQEYTTELGLSKLSTCWPCFLIACMVAQLLNTSGKYMILVCNNLPIIPLPKDTLQAGLCIAVPYALARIDGIFISAVCMAHRSSPQQWLQRRNQINQKQSRSQSRSRSL